MLTYPTALTALAVAVLVIGALAVVASVAAISRVVTENRRERLARHQSFGTYYRSLALHH
jgi:hypothetical protein